MSNWLTDKQKTGPEDCLFHNSYFIHYDTLIKVAKQLILCNTCRHSCNCSKRQVQKQIYICNVRCFKMFHKVYKLYSKAYSYKLSSKLMNILIRTFIEIKIENFQDVFLFPFVLCIFNVFNVVLLHGTLTDFLSLSQFT